MILVKIYALSTFFLVANGESSDTWPLPKDCGRTRFLAKKSRIIDGDKAELGQFPWMARIGSIISKKKFFYCGGSLISKYYVISAAHCEPLVNDIVRLGENYLETDIDCSKRVCAPPHQDIRIKKFLYHKDYCLKSFANDFGLIELREAVKFNDFVQPICFPSGLLPREGLKKENVLIAGWGLIKTKPPKEPKFLMYISAPVLDNQPCNSLFREKLLNSQLCIGYDKGKDSCVGDSGGPVFKTIMEDGKPKVYLIGVVSYGLVNCGAGPAVYTDVSSYVNWTLDRIENV